MKSVNRIRSELKITKYPALCAIDIYIWYILESKIWGLESIFKRMLLMHLYIFSCQAVIMNVNWQVCHVFGSGYQTQQYHNNRYWSAERSCFGKPPPQGLTKSQGEKFLRELPTFELNILVQRIIEGSIANYTIHTHKNGESI